MTGRRPLRNKLIATLGIAWITWLLGRPILNLGALAMEPWLDGSLTLPLKLLFVAWVVVNGYFEGYRAFQLRFSPRVVGRAAYLGDHPTPLRVVFALFFCMSLFHATRRQLVFRWTFTAALVGVIYAVKFVPQPYRGILDGGVVVGLAWGLLAVYAHFARYLLDLPHPVATDLPEGSPAPVSPIESGEAAVA